MISDVVTPHYILCSIITDDVYKATLSLIAGFMQLELQGTKLMIAWNTDLKWKKRFSQTAFPDLSFNAS